jgi:hypothetical protein
MNEISFILSQRIIYIYILFIFGTALQAGRSRVRFPMVSLDFFIDIVLVGDEPYRNIVGPHGLGRKNHRGQMLINLCERNGLIVTNTWFRKPKRRL